MKKIRISSGNKMIDDFIRFTQTNFIKEHGKMEFVPYDQFKNIKFIAEGGFSKIYKATWIDGPITWSKSIYSRNSNYTVVLKKLNNSKNITSKELNELRTFYDYYSKWEIQHKKNRKNIFEFKSYNSFSRISSYFGITQDPNSQDIMIIMPYYNSGDLIHFLNNDFYNISWYDKLRRLREIINGLVNIHIIGDLGISKSATESTDDNENYECWHSDPNERPTAIDAYKKIDKICWKEYEDFRNDNPTKIIPSSDIGPVTMNNPGAIYKSRPLSDIFQSAISLRSSRSQSITSDDPFYYYQKNNMTSAVKRKFEDTLIEKSNDNDNYTKEFELDINMNFNLSHNNEYITKEIDFDINAL
ncbi:hypothetical protein C1645_873592 [Glomus cerebriforme]|uniref:Protein kinase domain-containing protein n=1 Tax=Glomus cerebriforme TaxID=658196 RepID=A0A397T7E0_9GLOM|nr:hypothetical protein C1645_873592 [Glomus cerebriforme]